MSRVGKLPISIPDKVTVKVGDDRVVQVKGPKGELAWALPRGVTGRGDAKSISVTRHSEAPFARPPHGTTQPLSPQNNDGAATGPPI